MATDMGAVPVAVDKTSVLVELAVKLTLPVPPAEASALDANWRPGGNGFPGAIPSSRPALLVMWEARVDRPRPGSPTLAPEMGQDPALPARWRTIEDACGRHEGRRSRRV